MSISVASGTNKNWPGPKIYMKAIKITTFSLPAGKQKLLVRADIIVLICITRIFVLRQIQVVTHVRVF